MLYTAAIALLSATAAVAAPTGMNEAPIEARQACGTTNLFTNPGFNTPGTEWYLTGEQGTGTVTGTIQSTYFPTNPTAGGPTAYALKFTIPKGQTKSVRLQQAISAGISDDDNYKVGFNMYLHGTTSASCKNMLYAGLDPNPSQLIKMPPVQSNPPAGNFWYNSIPVPGMNWPFSTNNNIAGAQYVCTASSTQDAVVTIYLDNASLIKQCK